MPLSAVHARGDRSRPAFGSALTLAGAHTAWEIQLPLKYTDRITSYQLVDGMIYALAEDGTVRSLRADTGRPLWTRRLVESFAFLRGPQPAILPDGRRAVTFTLARHVLVLDPGSGREIHNVLCPTLNVAGALVAHGYCFQCRPRHRFQCIRLRDEMPVWAKTMPGLLEVAPVFIPASNEPLVACADDRGTVVVAALDGTKRFVRSLRARPIGWLATDGWALFVATDDMRLHAIEVGSGESIWTLPLYGMPSEGPVLSSEAVYQATHNAGLYRVPLPGKTAAASKTVSPAHEKLPLNQPATEAPKGRTARVSSLPGILGPGAPPFQRDPEGRRFLAEWRGCFVVLRYDGRMALIAENGPASPTEVALDLGPDVDGLSNPVNDAVFLTTPTGRIRCVRPLDGRTLTPADFQPRSAEPSGALPAVGREASEQPAGAPSTPPAESAQPTLEELLLTDPLRSSRSMEP